MKLEKDLTDEMGVSGYAAFLDPDVNRMIKKVLNEWGKFLQVRQTLMLLSIVELTFQDSRIGRGFGKPQTGLVWRDWPG